MSDDSKSWRQKFFTPRGRLIFPRISSIEQVMPPRLVANRDAATHTTVFYFIFQSRMHLYIRRQGSQQRMNKLTTYRIVFIREPIYRDMNE